MKRVMILAGSFLGISLLFGMVYYFSFRNALLHYNREAAEQNTQLLQELIEYSGKSEQLLMELVRENETEMVETAVTKDKLLATADYYLETFQIHTGEITREQLPMPGFMIGLDLGEMKAYIRGYMEELPVNEYLAGLVSYEILSFSGEEIVLRKSYDKYKVENQFYVCNKNGFVVVYYSDLKTVYEYTEIMCDGLSEEIKASLRNGFYVKDTKELYSILEGFTS